MLFLPTKISSLFTKFLFGKEKERKCFVRFVFGRVKKRKNRFRAHAVKINNFKSVTYKDLVVHFTHVCATMAIVHKISNFLDAVVVLCTSVYRITILNITLRCVINSIQHPARAAIPDSPNHYPPLAPWNHQYHHHHPHPPE
mmetsp:Transcript_34575/g.40016  ORF Transcript_34575/g.40016 Transcript_34575/m.40016 type:complete len:142 (-) Transcript_34575:2597-3022(-)